MQEVKPCTLHLASELKSFDSLKKMLVRGESLSEYAETLNISEKDLLKDLKKDNVQEHRFPKELICIPTSNLKEGKRLILVLDCGVAVSSQKRKNSRIVKTLEEKFLDFEQDIKKEEESFYYLYKLKGSRDLFLKSIFSKL